MKIEINNNIKEDIRVGLLERLRSHRGLNDYIRKRMRIYSVDMMEILKIDKNIGIRLLREELEVMEEYKEEIIREYMKSEEGCEQKLKN